MAITAEQQTGILEVAIGLFNAAPGKIYNTELANLVDVNGGNLSIDELADKIAFRSFANWYTSTLSDRFKDKKKNLMCLVKR